MDAPTFWSFIDSYPPRLIGPGPSRLSHETGRDEGACPAAAEGSRIEGDRVQGGQTARRAAPGGAGDRLHRAEGIVRKGSGHYADRGRGPLRRPPVPAASRDAACREAAGTWGRGGAGGEIGR